MAKINTRINTQFTEGRIIELITLVIALINNTHLIDLMPQHGQTSKNQTAEANYLAKNPFDERTSQQYLMPYVRLVQCQ
ncbi:hypothetical protein D934_09230 [Xylella fastidiosa subsp. sandyi Ann-1]|uniref:Uncharacterized protein n=1 Tax=Xylella fastidiosa subsp. sandyi Ann-1 TaxID=155920 RepID=A0A060H818_XYLFS|nr:hypothetical protein D934_09230 [Xylella fastidiosa subsp. sandyi Ann-1]